jgi:hypothetical protein
MRAAPRRSQPPAASPEDAERSRDETRDLDIGRDCGIPGGVRQPDQEAAPIPEERRGTARPRQLPEVSIEEKQLDYPGVRDDEGPPRPRARSGASGSGSPRVKTIERRVFS